MEKYISPTIKVKRMLIEDSLLAGSIGMGSGSDLGNQPGDGHQMAKDNDFVSPTSVWDEEEEPLEQ